MFFSGYCICFTNRLRPLGHFTLQTILNHEEFPKFSNFPFIKTPVTHYTLHSVCSQRFYYSIYRISTNRKHTCLNGHVSVLCSIRFWLSTTIIHVSLYCVGMTQILKFLFIQNNDYFELLPLPHLIPLINPHSNQNRNDSFGYQRMISQIEIQIY